MVWLQIINIKLHSKRIWPVLLLFYFADKETEAQRGGVTCPKPHSRSAGISTQCSLLHGCWPPCINGGWGWAPLAAVLSQRCWLGYFLHFSFLSVLSGIVVSYKPLTIAPSRNPGMDIIHFEKCKNISNCPLNRSPNLYSI